MSEDIDAKIKSYTVLADAAQFIKDAAITGTIPAEILIEQLADLVMMMLREKIVRAEELKKLRKEIANAPICMV